MILRLLVGALLPCLLCSGCGSRGPQQTLIFKATLQPGAQGPIDMVATKRIVNARVRAAMRKSYQVRTTENNLVEVVVRGAEEQDLEKIKLFLTTAGMLEFAAVAHATFNDEVAKLAQDAEQEVRVDGVVTAEWLPVDRAADGQPKVEFQMTPDVVSREREVDGKTRTEWLVVYVPGERITGNLLQSASESIDQSGRPCIDFSLDAEGAANMNALTTDLSPHGPIYRRMAIILNGQIFSAPTVQSAIGGRGQITGDFSQAETVRTVAILRSGTLPCVLTFEKVVNDQPAK